MNNDGPANDRIFPGETQFAFPIQVRLAGSIGFDVAEVAGVMIEVHRPTVMLLSGIEMGASRRRVCRRAIAFFMNVKTVFARREILNVGHDLDFIANFGERNHAGHFAA